MNRRGFLKSILAAGVAPYVVTTAGVLMPVRSLWMPGELHGAISEIYFDSTYIDFKEVANRRKFMLVGR